MAAAGKELRKRKRDQVADEEVPPEINGAELELDGDDDADVSDSGDEVEPFPELDLGSDSEDDSLPEDEDDNDEEEEDTEAESDDGSDAVDSEENGTATNIFPKAKTIVSSITGQLKRVYPEIEPNYDSDSSTEDDPNRVGNIPMHWYDDLPHVGYDINGKQVLRPAKGDELDKFLATVEDPSTWYVQLGTSTHRIEFC